MSALLWGDEPQYYTSCTVCDDMNIPINCEGMAPEVCEVCEASDDS